MTIDVNKTASSAGAERFKADVRTFGGLLLVLGAAATIQPLANVAAGITPGALPKSGVPLWALIAGIIQTIIGTYSMAVGYAALVHDYGNRKITGVLIGLVQLAWIPFMVDLSAIGMGTTSSPEEQGFIPQVYNPTYTDTRFVGSMGILAVLAYGVGFLGSMSFFVFALFAYQSGKPGDRSADYFRSRSNLYMFLLAQAGLTQLLLGSYALAQWGSGALEPPIGVAVYVVHFPEICIFIGLLQMIMGIWGLARRFGVANGGANDHSYQIAMVTTWVCVLSLMVMTQTSWAPGGELAGAAPTIACLVLGLHVMPAFLDYKHRTLPEKLPPGYYGGDHNDDDEADSAVKDIEEQEPAEQPAEETPAVQAIAPEGSSHLA